MQHKMYMTNLDHGRTGFYCVLIILTVSSTPTMPGVRPLNHPAFLQGRKTFRADWPCLHFDVPAWTMLSHPGVQSVIVILLVRKNRDETRKMVGVDVPEQERGRHAIIQTGTGNEYGQRSCTRALRIIPLSLKPAKMPRLTILERGQGHGFTPFLLPTRSVGPRMALRRAACCRVSPRDSDTTDSNAHQAQAHTLPRAPTVCRPDAQTALCPV